MKDKKITIAFKNEADYIDFTNWIYKRRGGLRGIDFTDVTIPASLRIDPNLLRYARRRFHAHQVTIKEIETQNQKDNTNGFS